MKKASRWLWGGILIALGVILGINALGIAKIDIFFPGWWTLIIIVPCVIGLFDDDMEKGGDIIGIIIGVSLLLGCQGVIRFDLLWKLLLPFILICIGISIVFGDVLKRKVVKEAKKLHSKGDEKEYWATFSGQNISFAKEKFEGCKLEAVFGGIKCDLREAKIEEDVSVRASAIFGGVTIYVPDNVNVKIASTSIFGGTSGKDLTKESDEKRKTIYIESTCVFGGVEIK